MNAAEARARSALLAEAEEGEYGDPLLIKRRLGVLELVDAYEAAGNQVYRLSETLGESLADTFIPATASDA